MSSSKEKKASKGRARAVAAWEWFKEAAWLQVLLIVGVVVGIVVAIPYAVKGITQLINKDDSTFYDEHRISYDQLNMYLTNPDKKVNGVIGDNTLTEDGKFNFTQDGFALVLYKSNCDSCNTLQKPLEKWYKNFNSDYGSGNLKLFTLDVSWNTKDDDKASSDQGKYALYDNEYITLEQQMEIQFAIKDTYLDQDDVHKSSSVTEEILNMDLTAETTGGTIPTPLIITFAKDKSATNYITDVAGYEADSTKTNVIQYVKPLQVIAGPLEGLSFSSAVNVAKIMNDVYQFERYKGTK